MRSRRGTTSVGDTGPSDLAKAMRDDGAPDAQAALTAAGFLHGYQRLWVNATHSTDHVAEILSTRGAYTVGIVATGTTANTLAPTAQQIADAQCALL